MKYDKDRDGLLYILIEHKSYKAHETVFQLLEYLGIISDEMIAEKTGLTLEAVKKLKN